MFQSILTGQLKHQDNDSSNGEANEDDLAELLPTPFELLPDEDAPAAPALAHGPETIQIQLCQLLHGMQQQQAVALALLSDVARRLDPANQTARERVGAKRQRPPGQRELLEHLQGRMQQERGDRYGLLPPRVQVQVAAQQAALRIRDEGENEAPDNEEAGGAPGGDENQ